MYIHFDGIAKNYLVKNLENWGFTSSNHFQEGGIYYPVGKGSVKRLSNAINNQRYNNYAQVIGTEYITAKQWLWYSIISKYNDDKALHVLPETYLLGNQKDKERLLDVKHNYAKDDFILKGNKQKRKALKLIKGDEISNHINYSNYVVAQRVIETSKSFTDRPFHFRLYLIVSLESNHLRAHIYHNGKAIYGHKGEVITHNNIMPTKDEPSFISDIKSSNLRQKIQKQIREKLEITIKSITHRIKHRLPTHPCDCHQLIGVDVLMDNKNAIKVIEANLGPDMKGTSQRDIEIKAKVQQDYFNLFKSKKLNSAWAELRI